MSKQVQKTTNQQLNTKHSTGNTSIGSKQRDSKRNAEQQKTGPHSPWNNKSEQGILEQEKHLRHIIHINRCSERCQEYGLKHVAKLRQIIPWGSSMEITPLELVIGNMPNTSQLIHFRFHSWVKYWAPSGFPAEVKKLVDGQAQLMTLVKIFLFTIEDAIDEE